MTAPATITEARLPLVIGESLFQRLQGLPEGELRLELQLAITAYQWNEMAKRCHKNMGTPLHMPPMWAERIHSERMGLDMPAMIDAAVEQYRAMEPDYFVTPRVAGRV